MLLTPLHSAQYRQGRGMEIEERRVLRRKASILEAYLRINASTLQSLKEQGLINKEKSKEILVSSIFGYTECWALSINICP